MLRAREPDGNAVGLMPAHKALVRALAVASEPAIFWDGSDAETIVSAIEVPRAAGRLHAAEPKFNGPSGRSIDTDFLTPLGLTRADAWLCDLVPHTCLNAGQFAAIRREYEPRVGPLGLPSVDLPGVPKAFADGARRDEILSEIGEAGASVVVLLGDQPIRHFLRHYDGRWRRLSDFGDREDGYGRMHWVNLAGGRMAVLPLAHPRQVSGLGDHSVRWRRLHESWRENVAPALLSNAAATS